MGRTAKTEQKKPEKIEKVIKELVSFDRALSFYLDDKPHRQPGLKDKEAVKLSMRKKCPSLEATIEEWKNLLDKF